MWGRGGWKKGSFTIIFMHGADVNASVATKCLGGWVGRGGYRGGVEQFAVFIRFNGATTMSALCKCVRSSTLAQPEEDCQAGQGRRGGSITILCPWGRFVSCFRFHCSFRLLSLEDTRKGVTQG